MLFRPFFVNIVMCVGVINRISKCFETTLVHQPTIKRNEQLSAGLTV